MAAPVPAPAPLDRALPTPTLCHLPPPPNFFAQFWAPSFRKDVTKLPKVIMIRRLENKPYVETLRELGMFNLEKDEEQGYDSSLST